MQGFNFVGEIKGNYISANASGLLVYDRKIESVQSLSKANGLTETGITAFKCSESNNTCIIGYDDGNLDIITPDKEIINQPAIKISQVIGDKAIYDIQFHQNEVWLASGVGLVIFDVEEYLVKEFIPIYINDQRQQLRKLLIDESFVYFTSVDLAFKMDKNQLFKNPEPIIITSDKEVDKVSQLFKFGNAIYAIYRQPELYTSDTLLRLSGNHFEITPHFANEGIRYCLPVDDSLFVSHADNIKLYDSDFKLINTIYTYGSSTTLAPQLTHLLKNGKLLISDLNNGMVICSFITQFNAEIYKINSPRSNKTPFVYTANHQLFALPGGNEFTFNPPLISNYYDGVWKSIVLRNDENPNFTNGNDVTFSNDKYYIASDRGGVAVLDEDLNLLKVFNEYNSPIHDVAENSDYDYYGITGIDSDASGNIYMVQNRSAQPLKILTEDGQWIVIQFQDDALNAPKTNELVFHSNGYILVNIIDVGLLVYDPNGTPANLSDDRYKLLTTSPTSGNLPSANITALAVDNDGEIWIGTTAGIGVIYSVQSIFENNFSGAQQIIVNQDGYNGYLFETETVEDIAVDGANRKWVATSNSGLFLISADGSQQLQHFTPSNSPLLEDKVTSIAIVPQTGEVFIASESGLMSYRGDATASATTLDNIKVFPNPVKNSYDGPISITGLIDGSYVRICDPAGRLVFETKSNGGQAIWDGRTTFGERVSQGVYTIYITSETGAEVGYSKVLLTDSQ
ncbi:MAG: two-component regulator propeller domain-containing protein [Salibacteraceae bacterium]